MSALDDTKSQVQCWLEEPSASRLEKLFNDLTDRIRIIDEARFTEGAIHSFLETFLRLLDSGCLFSSDEPLHSCDDSPRPDLVFANGICVELKRVRMNALELPARVVPPTRYNKQGQLMSTFVPEVQKYLCKLSNDDLLELKIKKRFRHMYKGCETIQELVGKGQDQARKYVEEMSRLPQFEGLIHGGYVAVQVGSPFVVKECGEKEKEKEM